MTTCRKRTDHRPMDGHDPKCANLRALPCDMVVDFNNEISLRSVGTPARRIFICCQKEESTLKLNRTA